MFKSTQFIVQTLALVPRLVNAEIQKLTLPKGEAGVAGPQGERGARGQRGEQGAAVTNAAIVDGELILTVAESEIIPVGNVIGSRGETGARGIQGEVGLPGECGVAGADGLPGALGEQGPQGHAGPQGESGTDGAPGLDGKRGEAGAQGKMGAAGSPGADGVAGVDGAAGVDGVIGETGAAGESGRGIEKAFVDNGKLVVSYSDGEQIEAGYVVGERGQRGHKGIKGVAGEKGDTGLVGLGFAWQGAYSAEATYFGQASQGNPNVGQASVVRHNGGVYVALVETSEEPSNRSEFWDVFV